MDDNGQDSRQPRKGPLSHGIDAFRTGRTLGKAVQAAKLARTAGVFAGALNPATIAITVGAIVVLLVFFIVLDTGTGIAEGIPGDGTEQPITPTLPSIGGGTGPIPGTGRACTAPFEGVGRCAVENLKQYFGGDEKKALIASLICHAESTSDVFALNPICPDYSVGLFQINAIAHCAGAYGLPYSACRVIDEDKRNTCRDGWWIAEQNIRYAESEFLSMHGTRWTAWTTLTNPVRDRPSVQNILNGCDISF